MKSTDRAARPAPGERERVIVDRARTIAEDEGWSAVTVRRLAAAIGYSQPVLYQHFPEGRSAIVAAVSRTGFADLRDALGAQSGRSGLEALVTAARTYVEFACEHPALYEAMFEMRSHTTFASDETPHELQFAFNALAELLHDSSDALVRTELFWSALHGIATLERDGRLPVGQREERIAELAKLFR
ncbi:TetR/AcrR family transcriptional regulator [Paramicrobacterium fandaimingii]|uniref:TetR/AcrR family transcriptional regulator n=1 Tax=Paramicrobacterium fandaimingii TaxID=2708079 RepID=UPI00141F2C8C|nr:TetR/AcrR family transcriptional regulator [Microbacterium fandaimingii]